MGTVGWHGGTPTQAGIILPHPGPKKRDRQNEPTYPPHLSLPFSLLTSPPLHLHSQRARQLLHTSTQGIDCPTPCSYNPLLTHPSRRGVFPHHAGAIASSLPLSPRHFKVSSSLVLPLSHKKPFTHTVSPALTVHPCHRRMCGVGFICHIKGNGNHKIVSDARSILCNMTHRGASEWH